MLLLEIRKQMLLIWNKKLLVRLVINTFCSICTIDSFIIIIDLVSYLCCGILCTLSVRFWMHNNKITLFIAIWSIIWLAMIFFDLFCHNNFVCAYAHIFVYDQHWDRCVTVQNNGSSTQLCSAHLQVVEWKQL